MAQSKLTDDDKLVIAATKEIVARGDERIEIDTKLTTVLDLIAVVQVALRHPEMKDNQPAARTEIFIRALIEHVDPNHGQIWRLLNRGFDPQHDRK